MFIKRFTRPFRQLRGKLTLSYTLTSVVSFLLIELVLITFILLFATLNISTIVLSNLKTAAPQGATYFVHGAPDSEALTLWLKIISPTVASQGPLNNRLIYLAVIDTHGQIISSTGAQPLADGTFIQPLLTSQDRANFVAVQHDSKGATSKVSVDAQQVLEAITPITTSGGQVVGILVMRDLSPNLFQLFVSFLQLILFSVIVVTSIAAIAGLVFGSLTARGLTRRLKRLSSAAERWGHGDFAALAIDTSDDELGQMSRQLNRMAEQLRNLLQARQKLATLEERNRLARDLHDSVKQQVFAISMQIGATKVLLKRDVDAAETRLHEADKLVRQAQQELTSLIRELRPVALEGKGLVTALRELATQWTQQTDIVANVRVESVDETQTISLLVEEALYRIAQEALANVARHSKATLVQMVLTITEDTVTLSILDNGQGFDAARQEGLGVGLLSMRERMKPLGGNVQIDSTPGKGTHILAHCTRSGVSAGDTATIV